MFLVCAQILTYVTCISENEAHIYLVALKDCPVVFHVNMTTYPPLLDVQWTSQSAVTAQN